MELPEIRTPVVPVSLLKKVQRRALLKENPDDARYEKTWLTAGDPNSITFNLITDEDRIEWTAGRFHTDLGGRKGIAGRAWFIPDGTVAVALWGSLQIGEKGIELMNRLFHEVGADISRAVFQSASEYSTWTPYSEMRVQNAGQPIAEKGNRIAPKSNRIAPKRNPTLLKEDPDQAFLKGYDDLESMSVDKILDMNDEDAICFGLLKGYYVDNKRMVWEPRTTHLAMVQKHDGNDAAEELLERGDRAFSYWFAGRVWHRGKMFYFTFWNREQDVMPYWDKYMKPFMQKIRANDKNSAFQFKGMRDDEWKSSGELSEALLTEDPDTAYVDSGAKGGKDETLHYSNVDAICFGLLKGYYDNEPKLVWGKHTTHGDLVEEHEGEEAKEAYEAAPGRESFYHFAGRVWQRNGKFYFTFWNRDYAVDKHSHYMKEFMHEIGATADNSLFQYGDMRDNQWEKPGSLYETLLTEDPERFADEDGKRHTFADPNAYTFAVLNGKLLWMKGGTHGVMIRKHLGLPVDARGGRPEGITMEGRLWDDDPVYVSFWNQRGVVKPQWSFVEELFKELKLDISRAVFQYLKGDSDIGGIRVSPPPSGQPPFVKEPEGEVAFQPPEGKVSWWTQVGAAPVAEADELLASPHRLLTESGVLPRGWITPDGVFVSGSQFGGSHREILMNSVDAEDPGLKDVLDEIDRAYNDYHDEDSGSYGDDEMIFNAQAALQEWALQHGWIRVTEDGVEVREWDDSTANRVKEFLKEHANVQPPFTIDVDADRKTFELEFDGEELKTILSSAR